MMFSSDSCIRVCIISIPFFSKSSHVWRHFCLAYFKPFSPPPLPHSFGNTIENACQPMALLNTLCKWCGSVGLHLPLYTSVRAATALHPSSPHPPPLPSPHSPPRKRPLLINTYSFVWQVRGLWLSRVVRHYSRHCCSVGIPATEFWQLKFLQLDFFFSYGLVIMAERPSLCLSSNMNWFGCKASVCLMQQCRL